MSVWDIVLLIFWGISCILIHCTDYKNKERKGKNS